MNKYLLIILANEDKIAYILFNSTTSNYLLYYNESYKVHLNKKISCNYYAH